MINLLGLIPFFFIGDTYCGESSAHFMERQTKNWQSSYLQLKKIVKECKILIDKIPCQCTGDNICIRCQAIKSIEKETEFCPECESKGYLQCSKHGGLNA
jgi:hypothetical protein